MNNTMNETGTIPYFWIAFYDNDTCLPQFDLNTGKQHLFKEINQSKLVRFGWYPLTLNLANILGKPFYHNDYLTPIIIELLPNQRLIALREEAQSSFTYTHCNNCGFDWQWMVGKEDGSLGDYGLPRYGSDKVYFSETLANGKIGHEVICPKCGAKNDFKCPECKEWWNKVGDDSPLGFHIECPKCKKLFVKQTVSTGGNRTVCRWLLGYQETLSDGTNKKCIMSIDKNGLIQLKGE